MSIHFSVFYTFHSVFSLCHSNASLIEVLVPVFSLCHSNASLIEVLVPLCTTNARARFKHVEALGRIIIRGPYPPSNVIISMHLQL